MLDSPPPLAVFQLAVEQLQNTIAGSFAGALNQALGQGLGGGTGGAAGVCLHVPRAGMILQDIRSLVAG